jgi:hypothetical protein
MGQDPRGIAGIGRVDEDRSVSLGAADDQQQLQIDALSAGHRAPSAALPTAAQPKFMYRRCAHGSPWGRRTASGSGGREESPPASTPRLAVLVALSVARSRAGVADLEPQTLAGRASGPVTAASRMAVVAESSVAPPCDEVGRRIHHSSTLSYSPTAVRRSTQGAARRMITQRPIRPARQQAAPPCLAPREWPRGIRGCSCTPKLP